MNESRPGDPSILDHEERSIPLEVEQIAAEINEEAHRVAEEMVGAELLATRGITENLGILLETLEKLNAVRKEQLGYLAQDYRQLLQALLRGEALYNLPGLTFGHCIRRAEHVADGAEKVSTIVTRETNLAEELLLSVWKPFFAVMGRGRRPPEPHARAAPGDG